MSRRNFLARAVVLGAVATGGTLAEDVTAAGERKEQRLKPVGELIDTNVYLSHWPFRRLPLDEPQVLVARLRRSGVKYAWAGNFDAILHKDVGAANARLAEDCSHFGRGLLMPFGSVNPSLPDWEEELRRCHEQFEMPGIRLHPNYHGYTLADPRFARLLDLVLERGLLVQVAVMMEDERTQHPLARVPHVDLAPLVSLLKSRSALRILLLNWSRGVPNRLVPTLVEAGQVYFDMAAVEGVGGLEHLLQIVPPERVVFGSYAPFFYFESALLKLRESELTRKQSGSVRAGNARRLLERSGYP